MSESCRADVTENVTLVKILFHLNIPENDNLNIANGETNVIAIVDGSSEEDFVEGKNAPELHKCRERPVGTPGERFLLSSFGGLVDSFHELNNISHNNVTMRNKDAECGFTRKRKSLEQRHSSKLIPSTGTDESSSTSSFKSFAAEPTSEERKTKRKFWGSSSRITPEISKAKKERKSTLVNSNNRHSKLETSETSVSSESIDDVTFFSCVSSPLESIDSLSKDSQETSTTMTDTSILDTSTLDTSIFDTDTGTVENDHKNPKSDVPDESTISSDVSTPLSAERERVSNDEICTANNFDGYNSVCCGIVASPQLGRENTSKENDDKHDDSNCRIPSVVKPTQAELTAVNNSVFHCSHGNDDCGCKNHGAATLSQAKKGTISKNKAYDSVNYDDCGYENHAVVAAQQAERAKTNNDEFCNIDNDHGCTFENHAIKTHLPIHGGKSSDVNTFDVHNEVACSTEVLDTSNYPVSSTSTVVNSERGNCINLPMQCHDVEQESVNQHVLFTSKSVRIKHMEIEIDKLCQLSSSFEQLAGKMEVTMQHLNKRASLKPVEQRSVSVEAKLDGSEDKFGHDDQNAKLERRIKALEKKVKCILSSKVCSKCNDKSN
eukprot:gene20524-22543_t